MKKFRSENICSLLVGLMLMALPLQVLADSYTFQFPSGQTQFIDRSGTVYSADANGQVTITDPKLVNNFLAAGLVLLPAERAGWNSKLPSVLTHNTTDYVCNNATTDGMSYTVPAGVFTAGQTLEVKVGGISVGTQAAKAVKLYIGDAVVSTITFASTMVGNWHAQFRVHQVTDLAHQRITAFGIAGTNTGATPSYAVDYATATKDFATAKTVKIQMVTSDGNDTMTGKVGLIELLP